LTVSVIHFRSFFFRIIPLRRFSNGYFSNKFRLRFQCLAHNQQFLRQIRRRFVLCIQWRQTSRVLCREEPARLRETLFHRNNFGSAKDDIHTVIAPTGNSNKPKHIECDFVPVNEYLRCQQLRPNLFGSSPVGQLGKMMAA
jgi:hypothetical protein